MSDVVKSGSLVVRGFEAALSTRIAQSRHGVRTHWRRSTSHLDGFWIMVGRLSALVPEPDLYPRHGITTLVHHIGRSACCRIRLGKARTYHHKNSVAPHPSIQYHRGCNRLRLQPHHYIVPPYPICKSWGTSFPEEAKTSSIVRSLVSICQLIFGRVAHA